jgi:hypothetical protein
MEEGGQREDGLAEQQDRARLAVPTGEPISPPTAPLPPQPPAHPASTPSTSWQLRCRRLRGSERHCWAPRRGVGQTRAAGAATVPPTPPWHAGTGRAPRRRPYFSAPDWYCNSIGGSGSPPARPRPNAPTAPRSPFACWLHAHPDPPTPALGLACTHARSKRARFLSLISQASARPHLGARNKQPQPGACAQRPSL